MRWVLPVSLCFILAACASAERPVDRPAEMHNGESSPASEASGWDLIPALSSHPGQGFWTEDRPKSVKPIGFGKLPAELPVFVTRPAVTIGQLIGTLPDPSPELPVYVGGSYPGAGKAEEVKVEEQTCGFIPGYALLHCGPESNPTGPTALLQTPADAEARAEAVLKNVWMPDWRTETVNHNSDGSWHIVFTQFVSGMPIYGDKPLQAIFNQEGQLTYVLARRRPLMGASMYPVRSPEDAWRLLREGRGFALDIVWGTRAPDAGTRFDVHSVEVGYVVPHASAAKEILQPYYIFRNEKRQALFVPAVTDPYVTWPKASP